MKTGSNIKKDIDLNFNKIIIENLVWYNKNLLTKYNKNNKKTIEKFKENHTKEIFKSIVYELKPFFNIDKSKNGKEILLIHMNI